MNIKKHIPNTLTLLNLLCGSVAIKFAVNGQMSIAGALMMLSLLFDFFDGFAARLLGVSSAIGKDLDSLADMVTFGVLPGFFMFYLLQQCTAGGDEASYMQYVPYLGFVITLFSALRLAKFNNDTRQSDRFIGVPTPANSMLICSLGVLYQAEPTHMQWLMNMPVLLLLTGVCSYLLVSELPLIALKFKHFGIAGNQYRYILLAISLVLLVILKIAALPLIIVLYILLSIVDNIFSNKAAKS